MNRNRNTTGMLVHGRHLEAPGWAQMVWGDVDSQKLGTLPMAILAVLDEGVRSIAVVTFGDGLNTTGRYESEVTKRFLLDRFDELEQFSAIKKHSKWTDEKELVRELMESAVADIESKDTKQELAIAAKLFEQKGITRVIEVTGASHGPRCQLLQGIARDVGDIPATQHWLLATDDMPYTGSKVSDTTVIESPHRGDDPILHVPEDIRPARLFPQLYAIAPEKRKAFLEEVAGLIQKYR